MKRFLLASIAAVTIAAGSLLTPTSSEAQAWRYRPSGYGYAYRPNYGGYYGPYRAYRPNYYAPRYYGGYYGYPRYSYPGYYRPGYYYGYPANRSAGVYLGAPGAGVYVR